MSNPDVIDALTDLIDRMDRAEVDLIELASDFRPNATERIRLHAKANGVALARNYVREALKLERER